MDVRFFSFSSDTYLESLDLRDLVLRKPLGMILDRQNLEEENDLHIGAFQDQVLVGCLILSPAGKNVKMRQVAVNQTYKGQGIGAAMVRFSEVYAASQGFEKMVLHARKTVLGFYLAFGYKTIGEEFEEVGIPHFKMEKEMGLG